MDTVNARHGRNAGATMPLAPFSVPPVDLQANHLFYGDNLTIMRALPPSSVDLIYLDPPFNSQRNYNLIYKRLTGKPVPEQEEAFCDAWDLDSEKTRMVRNMAAEFRAYGADPDVVQFWHAWMTALEKTQPRLLAYLVYMTYRLFEMHRLLRPTGSLYLHCDPSASHYIKVILDGVFGPRNFRSEIIWQRTNARSTAGRLPRVHDVLLVYSKSDSFTFNPLKVAADARKLPHTLVTGPGGAKYQSFELTAPGLTRDGDSGRPWRGHDPGAMGRHWGNTHDRLDAWDADGLIHWPSNGGFPRRRAAEPFDASSRQVTLGDVWTDVDRINQSAKERLGYPTQKPIALLERIIGLSSNPGDVVFDPFAGCGTSIVAAHTLGRRWIGCDIAILSVRIVQDLLEKRYGLLDGEHYVVRGVPRSQEAAQDLFSRDPRQFQHWAVELAGGFASSKHSDDRGVDGRLHFETRDGLLNMVLSVKGGRLAPAFIRELRGTVEREPDARMGGFICLQEPTRGMLIEADAAGVYEYGGRAYPKLQIRSVQDLLDGRWFDTPTRVETLNWTLDQTMPLGI